MSLFDRFYTSTGQPQSRQKSPGLGLCFKSRLTDIHETFGKTWAKFQARLGRILLSCGTYVKLSGFGEVSPWVSHSNKPKFQCKIKGQRETKKQKNPTKHTKNGLPKNLMASIMFQTHFILWILQLNLYCLLAIHFSSAMPNQAFLVLRRRVF